MNLDLTTSTTTARQKAKLPLSFGTWTASERLDFMAALVCQLSCEIDRLLLDRANLMALAAERLRTIQALRAARS